MPPPRTPAGGADAADAGVADGDAVASELAPDVDAADPAPETEPDTTPDTAAEMGPDGGETDPDVADGQPETSQDADAAPEAVDVAQGVQDADSADAEAGADTADVDAPAPDAAGEVAESTEVDAVGTIEVIDAADAPAETVADSDTLGEADSAAAPDVADVADAGDTGPDAPDAGSDATADACATLACDDNNACTADGCANGACTHAPAAAACDDGNACTEGDACKDGACSPGAAKNCDDGNACTADTCAPKTGCTSLGLPATVTCTIPDSCGGACEEGKCVAVADKVFSKVLPNTASDYGRDVLPLADGMLWAGTTSTNTKGGFDGWLYRTDPAGKLVWEQKYGGANNDWLHRALPYSDSFVFVGTTQSKGAGNSDVWFIRTDLKGAVLSERTYDGGQTDEGLAIVPFAPNGGWLVFWRSKSQSYDTKYQARVEVTDANGNSGTSVILSQQAEGDVEPQFAAVSGSSVFVAGTTKVGSAPATVWLRTLTLSYPPKPQWKFNLGPFGAEPELALTAAPGGGAVVAMTGTQQGLGGQARVVRFDANGMVLWDKLLGGAGAELPRALVQAGSGFVLAGATTTNSAGSWDGWLARLTGNGDVVWSATLGTAAEDMPHGVAVLPTGLALVGHAATAANSDLWLARTDAWGHASCKTAGKCLDVAEAGCDDNLPCTHDLCDSQKGCTAAVAPDGVSCGDEKACVASACAAGTCVAGKPKLFSVSSPFGSVAVPNGAGWLVAVAGDKGGASLVQFGKQGDQVPLGKVTATNGKVEAYAAPDGFVTVKNNQVAKYDVAGKKLYELNPNPWNYTGVYLVIPDVTGGAAVVAMYSSCSGNGHNVNLVDGTGTFLAYLGSGCSGSVVRGIAVADRGAVLLAGQGGHSLITWKVGAAANQAQGPSASPSPGGANGGSLQSLEVTADGGWLLGGAAWDNPSGGGQAVLLRIDATGQQTMTLRFGEKTSNNYAPMVKAALEVPGGYVVYQVKPNNNYKNSIAMVTSAGTVLWERPFGADATRIHAAGNGFAFLGPSGAIATVDAWGHADCPKSGICFSTPPAGCVDTDPCTLDVCNGPGGCVSLPAPDKTPCGTTNYCKAVKCTPKTSTCADQTTAVYVGDDGFGWTSCFAEFPAWGVGPDAPSGWQQVGTPGDGVVADPLTGRQWMQSSYSGTFADVVSACSKAKAGGKTDWRLPTRTELRSLVDYTKASKPFAVSLANAGSQAYWSATPAAGVAGARWTVDFDTGTTDYSSEANQKAAKCVRGP
ncbi:MAG: DUF1566 domain-containing protein [Deltaproteobacteria bacterium]|nr:DUF1566 domain-containing protein [Deltaproteobacteria bacterium]